MGGPRFGTEYTASLLVCLFLQSFLAVLGSSSEARAQGPSGAGAGADVFWVYVGTYTGGGGKDRSQGIYLLELDVHSGTLSTPRVAGAAVNPSFLAIHPSRRFLYAVNELGEFKGRPSGSVSAFSIDPARQADSTQPAVVGRLGPLSPGR